MAAILGIGSWLNVLSLCIGAVGLIFALYEYQSKLNLKRVLRGQYMVLFNRMKYMLPRATVIEKYIAEHDIPPESHLVKHLWTQYQGIHDCYVSMVGSYLQYEKKFTYKDIESLIANQFINTVWQEKIWRSLICNRIENKGKQIPEFFMNPDGKESVDATCESTDV